MKKQKPKFILTECDVDRENDDSQYPMRAEILNVSITFISSGNTSKIKRNHILKNVMSKLNEIK
jgi:hypothetical protein